MSFFWHLEFGGGSYIFGEYLDSYIFVYAYLFVLCVYVLLSAPGRKKKIMQEVKPTVELSYPAQVTALTTENASTSAATVDSLSFPPVTVQTTVADIMKPLSSLIPADERSAATAIDLHTLRASDEQAVKASYAVEQPSSNASAKARPVAIMAETSETNSLAVPVHVLSASEITVGSPSPCHTIQVFEEETRMSAESGSRSQTPAHTLPLAGMTLLSLLTSRLNALRREGLVFMMSVWELSSHFEYLENQSRGLDVTW